MAGRSLALRPQAFRVIGSRWARLARSAQRAVAVRCLAHRKSMRMQQRRQNRTSLAWPPANTYAVSRCRKTHSYRLYRSAKLYRHKGNLMITPVLMRGSGCSSITISRMEQTSAIRRSAWRFSLRELLLVMLAAGAFIGWGVLLYERSQRFQASTLYEQSPFWRGEIAAASEDAGESGSLAIPFVVTHADGPSAHRSESYVIPLNAANHDAFLNAFRSRVRQRLIEAGCKVHGGAESSGDSQVTFVYTYRSESRAGAVHICAFKNNDSRARIVVTMHEERAWRGDFNSGVMAGS